jgi:hypothetical protein
VNCRMPSKKRLKCCLTSTNRHGASKKSWYQW